MQDIRDIELRDSGSNANNKICFEARATVLRPRLHTERFPLLHTGPPTKRTSIKKFAIINLEYMTPFSNTTTSTQEARHKAKTQSPLHKRDKGTKPKHNHFYTGGIGTKPKLHLNHLYIREIDTNPKKRLQSR